MIKAEVIFDRNIIVVNGFSISSLSLDGNFNVYKNGNLKQYFKTLEQAIAYCLEN